ncbi:MAG: 50S ribosomal protein L10 [Micrococcaceae bacterium]
MATQEKIAAVKAISDELQNSNGVLLTEYRGLTVEQLKNLRRSMGENAKYSVVKNKLTAIAAKDAGMEGFDDLSGPTAIAFVKGDVVEVAKSLRDFAKENDALVIKGGHYEGSVLDTDGVKKLASLESREVLLAKLAGGMKASMSQAAALFNAPLVQAVRTVDALRAKVETEGPVASDDTEVKTEETTSDSAQTDEATQSQTDETPATETAETEE